MFAGVEIITNEKTWKQEVIGFLYGNLTDTCSKIAKGAIFGHVSVDSWSWNPIWIIIKLKMR